jgi:glycine hydroxymethyltransferase
MRQIARWIGEALRNRSDASVLKRIRSQVAALCDEFPLYQWRRERQREALHAG